MYRVPIAVRLRWGALQFFEQRLGVLQVGGVEAFAEPAVDRSEHGARFVAAVGVAKRRARLIVARNSSDRASCYCATSRALRKSASASTGLADFSSPRSRKSSASQTCSPLRSTIANASARAAPASWRSEPSMQCLRK